MKTNGWGKLASIYIGTVIGAGFASGQEIIYFFSVFGVKGIWGIMIATVLFSIIGAVVLNRVHNRKIKSYEDFIFPIFGKKLGKVIEIIITLFLLTGFCVMLAGSGAVFSQQFNLSYNIGIYTMSIATFLTFIFSVRGIAAVNTVLVPILLVGIVSIGSMVILKEGFSLSNYQGADITSTGNWVTSAFLYVSYNSISAIVIMTSLFTIIPNNKTAIKGGVFGGIGLGVLASFILIPTLIKYTDIQGLEIPMIKIADIIGSQGGIVYSFVLWFSMFTTAVSNGYGCIKRLSYIFKIKPNIMACMFCILTMPLAKIGFANLVSTLYPLFGYLGLFMIISIIGNFLIKQLKFKI